jgi:hypothetical protein
MKAFVRGFVLTGTLVIAANGLIASQVSNDRYEQWYKAKYGRNSPQEEARQNAERKTTFREEAVREIGPANDWLDQLRKAKLGRSSVAEEARQRAEQPIPTETAGKGVRPANTWLEDLRKAKLGRSSAVQEVHQKAD